MADKWTKEQEFAVKYRGGRLLVSAAAGSGKTKVLVDRLMAYILDEKSNINLDDFLIITYTKAAAAELRVKIGNKLSDLIAENPENKKLHNQMQRLYMAKISTVHSFCSEVLRQFAHKLDIPVDFRVAEESECMHIKQMVLDKVLNDAYDHIDDDPDFMEFVNTQGEGRNDRTLNEVILKTYHQSMNFPDPNEWLDKCVGYMNMDGITDVSKTKWGEYLLNEFHLEMDEVVSMYQEAVSIAHANIKESEKTELFDKTLQQLIKLQESKTWDEIVANKNIIYPNLNANRTTPAGSWLQNTCKDKMEKLLDGFVDSSDVILDELRRSEPSVRGMCGIVKRFTQAYQAEKRRKHLMDYADLEQLCLDLFCGKDRKSVTPVAKEVGARFAEVMVDEYQDSNAVQDAIFSALTDARKNCFMVGDVKQSIYQFRLADPQIFLDKYDRYADPHTPGAEDECRVMLSDNFRSGQEVISACNFVFENCMSPKVGGLHYDDRVKLREGKKKGPLSEMAVEFYGIESASAKDNLKNEAAFAAQRIQELLDGKHHYRHEKTGALTVIKPENISILLRSPSSQEKVFAQALRARGIRYVTSKDTPLLETQENIVLVSMLKVIHNPQQDIPLAVVLGSPVLGFTADDLAAIRAEHKYCNLYSALVQSNHPKAKNFVKMLSQLRAKAQTAGICQIIEEIFVSMHMTAIYSAMEDGEERLENLNAFYQHAAEFEGWGRCDLDRFMEHLENIDPKKLLASSSKQSEGCVNITSIHKSKGLEYPVVFLCGLSEGFNYQDLQKPIFTHKEYGIGINAVDNTRRIRYYTIAKHAIKRKMRQELVAEEIRVLYVAMTRARDRLIMTYAASKLKDQIAYHVLAHITNCKHVASELAGNMGRWVMLAAVRRTDAGEFHNMLKYRGPSDVYDDPWLIRVVSPPKPVEPETSDASDETGSVCPAMLDKIAKIKERHYDHMAATTTPSKMTATQLNRVSTAKPEHYWRKPGKKQTGGSVYGNLIHGIMEHIDFSACVDPASVNAQLDALVLRGLLSEEERAQADTEQLITFFESAMGQKLQNHPNVLREFQFSILDEPADPALAGERVLLQGVVDCAMVDDDGIVILDYKTDRVDDGSLDEKLNTYRPQLSTYAKALSRIFNKPVKGAYLYFFRLGKTVSVL